MVSYTALGEIKTFETYEIRLTTDYNYYTNEIKLGESGYYYSK